MEPDESERSACRQHHHTLFLEPALVHGNQLAKSLPGPAQIMPQKLPEDSDLVVPGEA